MLFVIARIMGKQRKNKKKKSRGDLKHTRAEKVVADEDQSMSFQSNSHEKLQIEVQVSDNDYNQALEVVPLSIYRPIQLDVTTTSYTVSSYIYIYMQIPHY
ncbi:hypothetical protein Lalb_Chr03g0042271 [Lupinus albus]|uniref:Uncharacterized protein n=1 Tax=Lupinus albus TaxID=3870 RepID=A0A6A4QVD8_LUPAL|nr:hypothetical protein Lalb_Chr03g0042271 [Lupinus albus]